MKAKKIRLGIGIGFGISVAAASVFIIVRIIQSNKDFENLPKLKMHEVHAISREDSSLFSEAYLSLLKVDFGWKDIYRQVSFMQLNQQYQVIMAKSDIVSNASLTNLVHLKKGFGGATVMITYKPQRLKDHGEFDFRLEPLQPVSNVFLTYSGDKAEMLIANDSVLHYRLSCANVSIRYSADSPVDIFLTSGDDMWNNANLRLDMIMVRRYNTIYFLFITSLNYKFKVDPILPGELLKE